MKVLLLRISLLLCFAGTFAAGEPPRSSVLVVYDAGDAYALSCFEQIIVTLEYNRIPYTTYNLASAATLPPLDAYLSVITATEMLWKLNPAACDDLNRYVRDGGGLAVLYRGWNANLRTLLGVRNATPPVVTERKSKGLRFTQELIPGINGTFVNETILADISAYDLQVLPSASVFATTADATFPAAWVNSYGRGRVIYWNSTVISEKIYRGFIVPSLGAVQPMAFSLILNLGIVCLDDFPNASPNIKIEPVKTEFNMTMSEFYAFRWYPDMLKLARKYGIAYTSGLIFGYGEQTRPPYTFLEWVRTSVTLGGKQINSAVWLARKAQQDIEVGYHGQNHQPLTLANWHSKDNMKLSLSASRRRWQYDNLGPDPLSYIPPMNVIDSTGMHALTEIFPSIRVVGSQYMGKFDLGQNREFGTDPWNPLLKSVPRITSGFLYDDFNRLLTLSELHTVGAWTHFVHPDDIIPTSGRYAENLREDITTENMLWHGGAAKNGILHQFELWIAFVKRHYPWLRFTDYAHSYDIIRTFESSSVTVKADGRSLTLRFNTVPNFCVLHLDRGNEVVSCEGGEIVQKNELAFSTYYVVRAKEHEVVLALRDSLPTILYRAGTPANLYLAGDSRYSAGSDARIQYPTHLASVLPGRATTARPSGTQLPREASPSSAAQVQAEDAESPRAAKRIVDLDPNDTTHVKALAREYIAMDMKEKAIPLYESIVLRHPNDARAWRDLQQLYTWSDRPADAARALAGYVDARPNDEAAKQELAELYVANEQQVKAIPLYEDLVARLPGKPSLRATLAELYVWNNYHGKAARQYEHLYAMHSADSSVAEKAVQEYIAANEPDEAARMLRQIIAERPGDVAALKQYGALLLNQDRQADAIPVYQRIVHAEPDSLPSRMQLARLYSWNQRPEDAALESRRILRLDPRNLEALRLAAETDRANDNWFDARAAYKRILELQPRDKDARDYLASVRREHGLLFTSAYEYIDDSNDLTREQLPVSIEVLQTHTADYSLKLRRERVHDNRLGLSALGYGAGLGTQLRLGRKTTLALEAFATRYESDWIPITVMGRLLQTFGDNLTVTVTAGRTETVEGIQALRQRLYTANGRGEFYWQTTTRWSISGLAEFESYTDDNLRSTAGLISTFKIVKNQPQIMLQASSIYQDTRRINPTSSPYWTPSELFTTSAGVSLSYTFFGWFTPEITEAGTNQGGVYSNNIGAKAAFQLSQFLQLNLEYGQLGSAVYRQTVARAFLSYRY